jgi:DNA-binding transcriptional ArsR family regulator
MSGNETMLTTSSLAELASLVGDPARANMLIALMDGRALTASELADVAGVTPQTASGHLARLSTAGLLGIEKQGRHRYHRLASRDIARMLEHMMNIAAKVGTPPPRRMTVGPRDRALRAARTCYDHLAGRLGVAIADRMTEQGQIELGPEGGVVTDTGLEFLRTLGIEYSAEALSGVRSRRPFCRPCLDWSERRPHLAGLVGRAICDFAFAHGWVKRVNGTRALAITPPGLIGFRESFGFRPE